MEASKLMSALVEQLAKKDVAMGDLLQLMVPAEGKERRRGTARPVEIVLDVKALLVIVVSVAAHHLLLNRRTSAELLRGVFVFMGPDPGLRSARSFIEAGGYHKTLLKKRKKVTHLGVRN